MDTIQESGGANAGIGELLSLIHQVGRGPRGARALSTAQARSLWRAALDGQLPPVALGAALMAMRMKGESLDELRALRQVVDERLEPLEASSAAAPPLVCLPCYNGARRMPNLSWLTALAFRRAGFRVLMHGLRVDAGRLATCEVVAAAGAPIADGIASARRSLAEESIVFVPIDCWSAPLAGLLARREQTGVRNTGHTVAKLLRPAAQALLLVPLTHEHTLSSALELLSEDEGPAILFRGVDGEPTLHPHSPRSLHCLAAKGAPTGTSRIVERLVAPRVVPDPAVVVPPTAGAGEIARWSAEVMAGIRSMPDMIDALVACARASAAGLERVS